jgi:transcriptional regulator with XRE-family HTH domain
MSKYDAAMSAQRATGERIREARRAKGLSGFELADGAMIGRYHVYVIERGESAPSAATIGRIAKALGVTTDWLLGATTAGGPKTKRRS